MFKTDFSRLGELWHHDIGRKQQDISFRGFLHDAVFTYAHRYLQPGNATEGIHVFQYPTDSPSSTLSLALASTLNRPDITGIFMQSETDALHKIWPHVRGELHAEFTGIPLTELTSYLNVSERHYHQQAPEQDELPESSLHVQKFHHLSGSLGLTFLKNKEGITELKTATLQQKVRKRLLWTQYKPLYVEDISLTEAEQQLLQRAAAIQIENAGYAHDNVDHQMILESCKIIQLQPAHYQWQYKATGVNNQSLPAHLFPAWEQLFSLIQPHLNHDSFRRMNITSISDQFPEGGA